MKTFAEFLKQKGYASKADFDLLEEKDRIEISQEYNTYLRESMIEGLGQKATSEELTKAVQELKDEIKNPNEKIEGIESALKEQGTQLTKLVQSSEKKEKDTHLHWDVKSSIGKKMDEIVQMSKSGQAGEIYVELESLKGDVSASVPVAAATKATVLNTSIANNETAQILPIIAQLATRRTTALTAFPFETVERNRNGQVGYIDWDEATVTRAAEMTAEGATFPESEATWQYYTQRLKKVADTIPYSDEFEYDNNRFINEIQNFLIRNVELKTDSQIVIGDNTGENLRGMETSMDPYVPVPSGILDASIYDLIVKVREAIEAQGGQKYRADVAFMNIADINRYKLKKDADNNYIMPPFVTADGTVIDGVRVLENNSVVANTLYMGDSMYAEIFGEPGFVLQIGYSGTDFVDGIKRMRIYRRLLFLIREGNKSGFRKVTDITAALATLAS